MASKKLATPSREDILSPARRLVIERTEDISHRQYRRGGMMEGLRRKEDA
jgi:hypothetical protein